MAACALMLVAAGLTLMDVVMRSIVRRPLFGTNDVVLLLLMLGVLAAFPYSIATRQHLRIIAAGQRLGPKTFRGLELFAGLCILAVLGGFGWQFALRAAALSATREGTQLLLIPLAPFWWIGAALMMLAAFAQATLLLDDAMALVGARPP